MTGGDRTARLVFTRRLLFVVTIASGTGVVATGAGELLAREAWPAVATGHCRPSGGPFRRPTAGCVEILKTPEGPLAPIRYNACGYRSQADCGAKPDSTLRIALLGTSIAEGLYVPYEEHLVARLEALPPLPCLGRIEVHNLASLQVPLHGLRVLESELARLAPDVVLIELAPYDLSVFPTSARREALPGVPARAVAAVPLRTRLRLAVRESRLAYMMQHAMLQDRSALIRAYSIGRADDALRVPVSDAYASRYRAFGSMLDSVARQLRQQGTEVWIVPVPNRIGAALLSDSVTIPGADPWAFANALREIAHRAGVQMVNVFGEFARTGHGESYFYPVDGHLTGNGNALVAKAVAKELRVLASARCAAARSGAR